ncbi:hypothetical protein [Candidatus Atelocyanobacterium thalassae]|uniref:N-acetyltransferase domain-containing protein n=2 Tax=Candidatus Atelocyanobacterium thalassae TaxID=713887 RepID=A0A086CI99_9CHRO|nr:hypothetical protein [Candidatus Atelocyanobacterium thalassa]KFF41913.1 MAG: hypothetical protein ucyna2_00292 [Candidatus Atelocyanobacterium thalassa isolate SIO64986]BDA40260.1 hypothetical protein CPARK_000109800 [cyanobacterium endosymbiont of Braarudosphaera bigelowii]
MAAFFNNQFKVLIRPLKYEDLDWLEILDVEAIQVQPSLGYISFQEELRQTRYWFRLIEIFNWLPNFLGNYRKVYIAELFNISGNSILKGFIHISPFNINLSTWRIERIIVVSDKKQQEKLSNSEELRAQLLRYCLEIICEARTWILEVDINRNDFLALYRQNGFQPLAKLTYWLLDSKLLWTLSQQNSNIPNLLPVSNSDAHLLYQLDCVSMPPLLRQVFDRNSQDFKTSLSTSIFTKWQQWFFDKEIAKGYVFEPQRKIAIGYFKLILSKSNFQSHQAYLVIHPAYTWLYPKLLIQISQIVQKYPNQNLEIVSADYQNERENYLKELGANRLKHTLLMSRSVWHKFKEVKTNELYLSEMLQGLRVAPRNPIPNRFL